jgi:hypothetical protein
LNGIDAAREILASCPQTKTILLTMYKEDQYVLEALRAGIKGYVKARAPLHNIGRKGRDRQTLSNYVQFCPLKPSLHPPWCENR